MKKEANMLSLPIENCIERPLFGGAVSSCFPLRFQDLSNIREVPDHQEVFADPNRDESLMFELLDFKHDVEDSGSALWFLHDLAREQDAKDTLVVDRVNMGDIGLHYRDAPVLVTTSVGQMGISKGRQGREAQNLVRVYLANLCLKDVATDVLITFYEPVVINPLSESANSVGAGPAVPAMQCGFMPASEVFQLAVSSFKVHNWGLFSPGT